MSPETAPHVQEIIAVGPRLLTADHTVRSENTAPLYVHDKVVLAIEERQAVQQAKATVGVQP